MRFRGLRSRTKRANIRVLEANVYLSHMLRKAVANL